MEVAVEQVVLEAGVHGRVKDRKENNTGWLAGRTAGWS